MMNYQDKSKEELIQKIEELQNELDSLKVSGVLSNSEIENTNNELWKSRERLNFCMENSLLAIIEGDSDFVNNKWMEGAEKIFGWSAQEYANIGYWETNLLNFEVFWSDETYRIFELDHDQFRLSHPDFLNFVHPDDKVKVNAAFAESFVSQSINVVTHRIITPAGSVKSVEERWKIVLNEEGRAVKAVGTCREIKAQGQ